MWAHDMIHRTQKYGEYYRLGQENAKRAAVTSSAPFCQVERFSTGSSRSGHAKKAGARKRTRWVMHLFSGRPPAATDAPHGKQLKKENWPYKACLSAI